MLRGIKVVPYYVAEFFIFCVDRSVTDSAPANRIIHAEIQRQPEPFFLNKPKAVSGIDVNAELKREKQVGSIVHQFASHSQKVKTKTWRNMK